MDESRKTKIVTRNDQGQVINEKRINKILQTDTYTNALEMKEEGDVSIGYLKVLNANRFVVGLVKIIPNKSKLNLNNVEKELERPNFRESTVH